METLARHGPVNRPSFKHDLLSSSKSRTIYQYLACATSNHGWVIIITLKNSLFPSYPGIKNISLYKHRSWKSEMNVRGNDGYNITKHLFFKYIVIER